MTRKEALLPDSPQKRFDDLLKQMVQGEAPSEKKRRANGGKEKPGERPELIASALLDELLGPLHMHFKRAYRISGLSGERPILPLGEQPEAPQQRRPFAAAGERLSAARRATGRCRGFGAPLRRLADTLGRSRRTHHSGAQRPVCLREQRHLSARC